MKRVRLLFFAVLLLFLPLFLTCERDEGTSPKKKPKETEEESWHFPASGDAVRFALKGPPSTGYFFPKKLS